MQSLFRPIKHYLFFFFAIFSLVYANAQPPKVEYRSPLEGQLLLSASFAELRPNHFHSGLDLKVGGVAGANLYAIEQGFVSRISVSPFGYGNAIYIVHPNGQTSVYGHLDRFSSKIKQYIERLQYERNTFAISEYITADSLPVKKGEIIGYAGNSGSSFGAHLHFEIRHVESEAPLNIIAQKIYKITDNIAPVVNQFAVFTLDSTFNSTTPRLLKSSKVVAKQGRYTPVKEEVIEVHNPMFFGISANDFMTNSSNKLGVYRMQAFIDDEPFWGYRFDDFLFEETRFINSFIAYDELVKNKRILVKTYVEKGNKLHVYENVKNDGLITLDDTLTHSVRIDLYDEYENKSTLAFKIKKAKGNNPKNNNLLDPNKFIPILLDKPFIFENEYLKVNIAENSTYSNVLVPIDTLPSRIGTFSYVWSIGNPNIPLHKPMRISLKNRVPGLLKDKAVIVSVSASGKTGSQGGTWDDEGVLSTNVSYFGAYSVMIDTIPPTIKASFVKGADFRAKKTISVVISDNLSGIVKYNGYIDDEWALFDYDAKKRLLSYTFDAKRIKRGKRHKLKIEVEDNVQNISTFTSEFLW